MGEHLGREGPRAVGPAGEFSSRPPSPHTAPVLPPSGAEASGGGHPSPQPRLIPNLSLPGEPRGAALVSLLQPLCQLYHREHHQSPEPQSHGHRGHLRCWGFSTRVREGPGRFWEHGKGHAGCGEQGLSCALTPDPPTPPFVSTLLP